MTKMKKITRSQASRLRNILRQWDKENLEQVKALRGLRTTKYGGKAHTAHSKRLGSSRKKMLKLDKKIDKFGFKHYSHASNYLKRHRRS